MEPVDGGNDATLREALINRLKGQGVIHTREVEEALRAVPRHLFVPEVDVETAYSDAYVVTKWKDGQAISSSSQPHIMAMMLEMLDLRPGQRVLEIGAGTGYNAALMAHIVGESGRVVTIDLDEDIVEGARKHLSDAGVENVQVVCNDGGLGWEEAMPYDRVILTVGSFTIASAWYEQLRAGGRLLLPFCVTAFPTEVVMMPDQWLLALDKKDEYLESVALCPCFFMPLRGAFAASPVQVFTLGLDTGITCSSNDDIDTDMAYAALNSPAQSEETGVSLAFHELTGLRLWLALREPHYCELYVKGDLAQSSSIPSLTGRGGSPIATVGCYEQNTWSLLVSVPSSGSGKGMVLTASGEKVYSPNPKRSNGNAQGIDIASSAGDSQRPFNVTIRSFGPENASAQHLKEQVKAWERAGRPFVWRYDGTMEHVQVRVYPSVTGYEPQDSELVITRGEMQIVFGGHKGQDGGSNVHR